MDNFHVVFPYLGWHFDISRVAFQVGTFKIYWYGVIIMVGLFLAIIYAYKNAARYNVNWNKLFNCVLVGIVTGVIGARLYFCIFHWEDYFVPGKFIDIIKINEGGLAIYGGIIGALLGGLINRSENPEDEDYAHSRRHDDIVFNRAGNRPLGQLYEPGGLRHSHRSAVGDDERGHEQYRGSSVLFIRIALVSARIFPAPLLRKVPPTLRRTDVLYVPRVVRLGAHIC